MTPTGRELRNISQLAGLLYYRWVWGIGGPIGVAIDRCFAERGPDYPFNDSREMDLIKYSLQRDALEQHIYFAGERGIDRKTAEKEYVQLYAADFDRKRETPEGCGFVELYNYDIDCISRENLRDTIRSRDACGFISSAWLNVYDLTIGGRPYIDVDSPNFPMLKKEIMTEYCVSLYGKGKYAAEKRLKELAELNHEPQPIGSDNLAYAGARA